MLICKLTCVGTACVFQLMPVYKQLQEQQLELSFQCLLKHTLVKSIPVKNLATTAHLIESHIPVHPHAATELI